MTNVAYLSLPDDVPPACAPSVPGLKKGEGDKVEGKCGKEVGAFQLVHK